MTSAREELLERVFCIHYPVQFKDTSEAQVQALIDSKSEVNAIYPTFAKQLGGFSIRTTDHGAQKIDGTILDTHGIVVAAFSVVDKANRVRFFEETFLVANVSPKVVLGMLLLTLSGVDVDFWGREFRWRTYTIQKTLPTTRRIELVGKKDFVAAAFDPEHKTYVVYVASLSSTSLASLRSILLDVYPFQKSQVSGIIVEDVSTKVAIKYLDFADVFSPDLASKLPEHTGINNYTIELVNG